jgi:hypothetical protein
MVNSPDKNIHNAGIISLIGIVLFIGLAVWRGVGNAVRNLIIPATVVAIIIGAVGYGSGLGSGKGMAYIVLSFVLIVAMFVIGTTARAMAGSLSSILFWIVALTGGIFGRSVGGGVGTVIMAVSCAYISKQAIKGAKGFEGLRNISFYFTSRFGTSFRKSNLTAADFSGSEIRNADFSDATTTYVKWEKSKKVNCREDEVGKG